MTVSGTGAASANEPRTAQVRPASATGEAAQVLEWMVLIAIVALLVGGAGRAKSGGAGELASYQVRFQAQPQDVQRTYRELDCALEDIVRMRSATGKWPAVAQLAGELVDPFPRGTWELRDENGVLNYVSVGVTPAYLLCIQEPPPGSGAAGHQPGPLDEFHRRLVDGTVVHTGVWMHAAPRASKDALDAPQRDGWTEIVSGVSK